MFKKLVPILLTRVPVWFILRAFKKLITKRGITLGESMFKVFLAALADLFDAWKDGSNDPGDMQSVADAAIGLVNDRFDEDLDNLLAKPFVGTALGFLAGVLRSLSD